MTWVNLAGLATDRYTLSSTGAEVYEPRFTVHGYRYVELTGFPGTPTASTITGRTAWTAGAVLGTPSTSNALINQLQQAAIVWGQRSNMLAVPTDCPSRNERLGWTGDIAAFANKSTFNIDMSSFLTKCADDLTDAQHADGAFTNTAPDLGDGQGVAGWGDAGVLGTVGLPAGCGGISSARRYLHVHRTGLTDLIPRSHLVGGTGGRTVNGRAGTSSRPDRWRSSRH